MPDIFRTSYAKFPTEGPLMGLDLGSKTIGLAVSNPERRLATPLTTLKRTKFTQDAQALLTLCQSRQIVGLIFGLPLNMDGSEGARAQSTRAFIRNLQKHTTLPFAFWDERLSTAVMERELIALNTSRAKRSTMIDALAANYILQGALDRITTLAGNDVYQGL